MTLEAYSESYTCFPLFSPICHSPCLPSGVKLLEKLWTKLCGGFLVLFLQLTKLPSKPADCISPVANAQHPALCTRWAKNIEPPLNMLALGSDPTPAAHTPRQCV